jgi:predicted small integral membrane protein
VRSVVFQSGKSSIFALLLVVLVSFFAMALVPATSEGGSVAMRASDFLNTLGADTHLIQGLETPAAVIAGLRYTGVRNLRDDATRDTSKIAKLCAIHNATGAMVDELPIVDSDPNNIANTRAEYEQLAACGAMLAAEGPNEPNNFNFNYKGKSCSTHGSFLPCAQYMSAEYAMVKGDPMLAGMQVWDQTEPGAEPDNTGLQFLTVPSGQGTIESAGTVFADVANLHNYVMGNGQKTIADNQAWNAESTVGGPWDGLVGEYCNKTWKGYAATPIASCTMPKVTTETGWPSTSITQDQQGKLITNVYLSAAKLGWQNTFVYLLFDEPQANNAGWGFFSQSDGTANVRPKLLGTYIHNMTTILSDTSSKFTPGTVNYSVANEPNTVHDLLMEKSNGTYDLIIWGDQVPPKSANVIVHLGSSYPTVNLYDITSGTTPTRTLSNATSVPLTLTDHALIVEFRSRLLRPNQ